MQTSFYYVCLQFIQNNIFTFMTKINPNLLTANNSTFMVTVLEKGQGEPPKLNILTIASASKGATTLSVAISVPNGLTASQIVLFNGTYFIADNQIIVLDGNFNASANTLTIDPLVADLPSNTLFSSYVNSVPVLGLEAANLQLQKEVNQVVLLSSKGWSNKDYSTGTWQFSGQWMIPINPDYASTGQRIIDALLNEKLIWCERILANGKYIAGIAVVTDCSDTVSGNAYVSTSLTLQGSGKTLTKSTIAPVQSVTPTIPSVLNPGYRVVILAGQSNAEGSGSPKDPILDVGDPRMFVYAPGSGTYSHQLLLAEEHIPNSEGEIPYPDNITFATHFVKNYLVDNPADRVVILTCAQGNTGFSTNQWNPNDYLYNRTINIAQEFLAGYPQSNLIGIIWHQGERDHDNGYDANTQKTKLLAMLDGIRTALGATLPFICGGLSPDWIPGDSTKAQFNQMFANLNQSRSYVGYADSDGLSGGGSGNEIHFNAPSLRIFGARYYQAWKTAKDYVLGGSIPAATNLNVVTVNNSVVKLTWVQSGVYNNFNIQYKLNSSGTWLTTNINPFTYGLVTGLTANSLYNFRIKTNGNGGSVSYSSVVNLTTGSNDVTLPSPAVWMKFEGTESIQNDEYWGWASGINLDDSTNLVTDTLRGKVCRLYDGQGYAFYHQVPEEMTQTAWIKMAESRPFACIWGAEQGSNDGRKDLMINNHDGLQAWGSNYTFFDSTVDTFVNDTWIHVGWTVSKATSTIKLYVNGILRKTSTGIIHNPQQDNSAQFLGLMIFGGGSWDNYLDDCQMWESVLTDDQMAKVYQSTYK